jgi:predicted nucleic acid-binding protein
MKNDLLFVADTNVIVSALIFEHSTPGQAFYGGIEKGKILLSGELVLCQ